MQDAVVAALASLAMLGSACRAAESPPRDVSAAHVPNSTVNSIEFHGNKHFKNKVLLQRLGIQVGDHLDPFLAESGRLTLIEIHRKIGFALADVTLDTDKLALGELLYTIQEGPRVKVGAVKFLGNKHISSHTLKKVIKTKTKKWFYWPFHYTEQTVADDLDRLREFYYDRGFLDYRITARTDFAADRTKTRVTFIIEEGPVYRVKDVIFAGNEHFTDQELRPNTKLAQDDTFRRPRAQKDAETIADLYRQQGYVDARVVQTPKFMSTPGAHQVDVEFEVNEGQRFRIGKIDITGNEMVYDRVVRRVLDEYDFTPGNWYDAKLAPKQGGGKLEKFAQRASISDEVMIRPIDPADGSQDHKDVRVDVKEGMTGFIMPGIGVSTSSGVIGRLMYQQQNFDITDFPENLRELVTMKAFRGAGQTFRVALEPGTEVSQYSVSFTDPYFRDRPTQLDVFGASWLRYRESYDEGRLKLIVGFDHRRPNRWNTGVSFRAENVEVEDLDFDAPQQIRDVIGDTALLGARLSLGKTTVDDPYDPGQGYTIRTSYEQLTGNFTFGIADASVAKYFTLWEDILDRKTVLAAKVQAATVVGEAPPFEKFYAGGQSRYGIRGFEYRGVSTRGLQTNVANPQFVDPIGSDWVVIANAEIIVPLIDENISGLLFTDTGTVDTGSYRLSIGTGIQIMIPKLLGPIPVPMRFELATPLLKDELDERQVFSFMMGGPFPF